MDSQCTYYASPAWQARVEASLREWSMHMFLRFRAESGVNQVRTNRGRTAALERLGERLDESPARLRWTPAWTLCQRYDAETLGFTWDEVETAWREVNMLADAATDDPASACPHEAVRDDRCLFHLPPDEKDDERVRDALVAAIESDDPADRALDGARFGTLDLSNRELTASVTVPIDLRFAVVHGGLDLSGTTIPDSMFSMRFATVRGDASFRSARFGETATFVGAGFRRNVSFYRSRFESKARFTRARFGDEADGSPGGAEKDRRYATFAKAQFEQSANFHGAQFTAVANLDEAAGRGLTTLVDTSFADEAHARDARFDDIRLAPAAAATPVDLSRSRLDGGELRLTDSRADLTKGVLGDVDLVGSDEPGPRLDHLRLFRTEFDDFDVAGHRDAFEAVDWRIHGYGRDGGLRAAVGRWLGLWSDTTDAALGMAGIENTYLRAKRGATAAGDTRAAGEFFRKEMGYRRLSHGERLRALPRRRGWTGLWRWVANLTMGATTGYGERPSRVVLSSAGLCLGFAVLYAAGLAPGSAGVPFREYVLFSFQSFISFIIGTPPVPGVDSFGLRVFSALEGFIGAFFVALFVFTLTRSVHR
ncbi:hypothetical protein [Haloarchaeobius salinus]|uniref:hypothetical protein n=1 Tax=Haloarchaeobius salinus TaxID=1198298 RepID=UPI00210AD229|nr:hypothetical protein [Haloarchaeobius salinus]